VIYFVELVVALTTVTGTAVVVVVVVVVVPSVAQTMSVPASVLLWVMARRQLHH
jgi:hypothetical protein